MKDTGGSAFPYSALTPEGPQIYKDSEGMTLRDYFASQAMVGFMIGEGYSELRTIRSISKTSYEIADAMIEERNK